MGEKQDERACALEWRAESLRFTGLFPSKTFDPASVWLGVTGADAELDVTRKGIERRLEGVFLGQKLSLAVRPERVDWILSANVADEDMPVVPMPTVGEFPQALDVLKKVMVEWVRMEPTAFERTALGAVLLAPVADRTAGYERVAVYLPSFELDPASRDFSYQINRPRDSASVEKLKINRLCKWSVIQAIAGGMAIVGGKMRPLEGASPTYAVRLELDISTDVQSEKQLGATETQSLMEEFVGLAKELAAKGDIP